MKRFLKFLKWAGITLGTLIVLFIGINAFDETLDPGAASILNAQPTVKAEENAYFYLISYLPQPPEWQFQGMELLLSQRAQGA